MMGADRIANHLPCPCCGSAMTGALPLSDVCRKVSPTMAEIIRALSRNAGIPMSGDEIASQIYASVPVEPANGPGAVKSVIAKQKHKLPAMGWRVESEGHGPGAAGYSLKRSDAKNMENQRGAQVG